ncbi:MAG: 4-hydroxy-tetrahydrodipicolinate synthase [Oligoflexia bacterium]|nr:4-hydroxy-tetrahydrodipicolinate synthase [Oligoflexia bacterium]
MSGVLSHFFEGVTTALITPFKNGEIDFNSLKTLLRFQIDNGIEGFVVCGTTGESTTLSLEEKTKLLNFVITEISGQVPVIVGNGTFSTQESIYLASVFEKIKPGGLLTVTPYYNKPPQRGLVKHYAAIAQSTKLPIILYNVPSRTSLKMEPETVLEIAMANENVVGVKEAAGDIEVIKKLKKICPKDFMILSGDDGTFTEAMAYGAQGVISVLSHVVPSWCVKAAEAGRESFKLGKKSEVVDKLTSEIKEVCDLLFCEANPIPVKWAMKEMGIIESGELRLPLVELDKKFHKPMLDVLRKMGSL